MEEVNVYDAKTHLSRLINRAEAGEEIVITRHGRPVARLIPIVKQGQPRKLGSLRGKVRMSDDFDQPLPEEVMAGFEGSS